MLWTLVNEEDEDAVRALTDEREDELLMSDNMLLHVVPTQDRNHIYGYRRQSARQAE